ncbi:MAG TPA: hypothetical protein VH497_17145 [Vicinamibacterales bacterium]|jgi:hypothetical protein
MFVPPFLTPARIRAAYVLAGAVDLLQLLLGPFGWAFADEVLDIAAMALLWRIIGFHPLLLPTFALEIVPLADMLPTWTGCVALVIALRKRQQAAPPPSTTSGTVIDV